MSGLGLEPEEAVVLDDLRERSDGTHEQEYLTDIDYGPSLLRRMALKGLVRLSGLPDDPHFWATTQGISALLSYEKRS
jgi:hypothetical protein